MLSNYDSTDLLAFNLVVSNGVVLNEHLLHSCFSSIAYYDRVKDQIASVFRSIVKNHIFQDGNKRVAVLFLFDSTQTLGIKLPLTDDEIYDITITTITTKISVTALSKLLFG